MQFTQLKAMEKNKREYLWSILEDSKVLRQFGEVLNLTDSDREAENEAIAVQDVTDLFSVVSNSPWFGRTKMTWYSPEYLYNLKELLQLFPSDHQKVRQVLKIPKTSFRRLKLETAEENAGAKRSRRFVSSHPRLSREEQVFISKIVEHSNRTDDTLKNLMQ